MKLHELIRRENFPSVFIDTLGEYLKSRSGWQGEIIWGTHGSDVDLNLLVNTRLNIIYPVSMSKKSLMPFVAEYAYHKNPLRRFLHQLYINITLAPLLRYFFSSAKIHITKYSEFPAKICILPGNHSIRLIDLDLNRCLVLAKKGYGVKKLKNAVSSRLAYPTLPGPRIVEANIDEGWYLEEKICGLPVDRIESESKINGSLSAAKSFLVDMHDDTATSETALTWVKEKFQELDLAIDSLPSCFKKADIRDLQLIKGQLETLSEMVIDSEYLVSIALTHGDFQSANLLVPSADHSRDVYIIDWEYSGRRCSHYDWFVYGLRSRSSKGLASRVNFLLCCDVAERSTLDWYDFSNINLSELRVLLILFLIDEFLFRLDDTSLPNLERIPVGFLNFIREIEMITDMFTINLEKGFDVEERSN